MSRTIRRRRNNRAEARPLQVQNLEARIVLAADPLISEFQAANASTHEDNHGEYSDWIEIHNPADTTVNLGGWYLTDDEENLDKWTIPADTQLDADQYLLVYASGKNEAVAGQPLHTNFRLSAGGEFLALVKPDGSTIVQSFDYDDQIEDQSFGLAAGRDLSLLVPEMSPLTAIVPDNGASDSEWMNLDFDDTGWSSGQTGVGYEVLQSGFIEQFDFDQSLDASWTIDNPGASTTELRDGKLTINTPQNQTTNSEDRGTAPIVLRDRPTYADGSNASMWEFMAEVSQETTSRGVAGIMIYDGASERPVITFGYSSNSRFELRALDDRKENYRNSGEESYKLRLVRDDYASTWTAFVQLVESPNWLLVGTLTDGIDDVPVVADPHPALFTSTGANTMTAHFDKVEIVVPDERPTYGPLTQLDVNDMMNTQNSSIYMRIPFELSGNPSRFDELRMDVRFDDGYRAYLNGQLVSEENTPFAPPPPAPNVLPWNSSAEGTAGALNGQIPLTQVDLLAFRDSLRLGSNVLAIHGLNIDANDHDFFFDAQLIGTEFATGKAQVFASPTPGSANLAPAAQPPQVIGEEGLFFGSQMIEMKLTEPFSGLEIRYTLDGSVPTADSFLYTNPITLTTSAMLQARVFDASDQPTLEPSAMTAATFIAASEQLRDRSSDIPIIILDTIEDRLPGSSSTSLASVNVVAMEVSQLTGRATLSESTVDYLGRGGVRDRGSSTAGQTKPNMSFETWGADGTTKDDDENVGLLGFSAESDWVLHAPFNFDRAMIRNQFAYATSNNMGRWAPGTRAVEVYLNRNDGIVTDSDYMGVYVLTEKITQGPGRVDIADIDRDDNQEPEISGGYIWKVDRTDPDAGTFTGGGIAVNWVHPKSPRSRTARIDQKATNEQQEWVINHFNELQATFRGADINDPEGYSKYIDVGSWVDHHLLGVFMDDVDAFALSAYLMKDRDGKIQMGPAWDYDRSVDSLDGRDDDPTLWGGSGGSNFFSRGWYSSVFRDKGFWQAYVDRWTELRQTHLSLESIDALIDKLAGEIEESQERNYASRINRSVLPRRSSAYVSGKLDGTWRGEVEHMRAWLHERAAFMDSTFTRIPDFVVNGEVVEIAADPTQLLKGIEVAPGQEILIEGPKLTFFNDTNLLSTNQEPTTARYIIPTDDSLGTDWVQAEFDDSAWSIGKVGIGYDSVNSETGEVHGDFGEIIETLIPLPNEVRSGGTTVLTRFTFDVADADAAKDGAFILKMKYDDGFVAYLNGEEIHQQNLRDTELAWNSRAEPRRSSRDSEIAETFEDFDISEYKHLLVEGTNVLAIRVINSSSTSKDILIYPELVNRYFEFGVNPNANVYYTVDGTDPRGPDGNPGETAILANNQLFAVQENTRVRARTFDDVTDRGSEARIVRTDWSGIIQLDVSVGTSPLVISEIHYNPQAANQAEAAAGYGRDDFEFIEIFNPSDQAASLTGIELVDGVEFDFFESDIKTVPAGERIVVASNAEALSMRYGAGIALAGSYEGQLDNRGEDVDLIDATGDIISSINYGDNDPWPTQADGLGASLELAQTTGLSTQEQGKWYNWQGSTEYGGTPGTAGSGPFGVVINEVLTNTQGQPGDLDDAIELLNTTTSSVDLTGWYLSDSIEDPFKFAIPAGTSIAAGQYLVFDEDDFDFGLNGIRGDSVWLVKRDAAEGIALFGDEIAFGGTRPGESLGRIPDGSGRLTPLEQRSLGSANITPRVGPLFISEIQYNPVASEIALETDPFLEDSDLEFIEIHNPTDATVSLTGWRLRGGADYNFDDNIPIADGQSLVIVKFNPDAPDNANRTAAFKQHYGIGDDVTLLGGYTGQLNNGGDRVQLVRMLSSAGDDVHRVQEDEVLFDDLPTWPTAADGTGFSLQRIGNDTLGNDSSSWFAGQANPGSTFDGVPGDFDDNRVVNAADIDLLFAETRQEDPDSRFDLTGDGQVNEDDRNRMIKGILATSFGDSNLDGIFNSSDLVQVFQNGKYEEGLVGSAGWEDGDWNGDGVFSSNDLVLVFQEGGYIAARKDI